MRLSAPFSSKTMTALCLAHVLIPGCNDEQIPLIAEKVSGLGAFVMNVMPVIPCGSLKDVVPPTPEYLERLRSSNEQTIPQFRHCSQCRADAFGLIGADQS